VSVQELTSELLSIFLLYLPVLISKWHGGVEMRGVEESRVLRRGETV
jgi:hypothetical protein